MDNSWEDELLTLTGEWGEIDSVFVYYAPDVSNSKTMIEKTNDEGRLLGSILQQIEYCLDGYNEARLKGEKLILYSGLKINILLREHVKAFRQLPAPTYGRMVSISNVKFHFSKPVPFLRKLCVCVIVAENVIYVSLISEANKDGIVDFQLQYTFSQQPPDLQIYLQIYVLTLVEDQMGSGWHHVGRDLRENPTMEIELHRPSLFKLYAQGVLDNSCLNMRNEICLPDSSSTYTHKVVFDVTSSLYEI